MMKIDAGINPFTNFAIGNNYFADLNPTEDLDLDDIDEIDTNNMAIYSGSPIKKDQKYLEGSSSGSIEVLKGKKQPKAVTNTSQKNGRTTKSGKNSHSLLTKISAGKSLPEIKINVLNEDENTGDGNDVLSQAINAADISPNSLTNNSNISNYDENSLVSN